jgi:hypothetical protein
MKSISICISTWGDRIFQLSSWTFDERINYLVLWQKGGSIFIEPSFPSNVQLIISESRGVAITRNIALNQCNTKWLWFMDDDVTIPNDAINNLLKLLPDFVETDILIASVVFGTEKKSKKFIGKTSSIFNIFSLGTIQIICCPALAKRYGCLFPTNMGAGTHYPVCDEPVFLTRMIRKAHVTLCGIPNVSVFHPPISSGLNLSESVNLISRAMLFREAFGFPICFLISACFFVKHWKKIKWKFLYLFYFFKPN